MLGGLDAWAKMRLRRTTVEDLLPHQLFRPFHTTLPDEGLNMPIAFQLRHESTLAPHRLSFVGRFNALELHKFDDKTVRLPLHIAEGLSVPLHITKDSPLFIAHGVNGNCVFIIVVKNVVRWSKDERVLLFDKHSTYDLYPQRY